MRLTMLMTAWMCLTCAALPGAAQAAEGLFAPRVIVNDRAITNYQIDQRMKFLAALNAPGDLQKEAEERLIEEQLELQATQQVGITPTEEQITAGMAEFASRANLTTEQFVAEIAKLGVEQQTFRDFVTAGVAWRTFVQAKFGPQIRITKADIEHALALSSQRGPARVLLSELMLPATPEYAAQSEELATRLSQSLHGTAAFADAARQYSASNSAANGGQIDWMPLANLPPQLQQVVLALAPGQVSAPIRLQNAIALFQLRGIEQSNSFTPAQVSVKYAEYLIPGGQSPAALSAAAALRNKIDSCDDLYGIAKGQPAERLTVTTQTMAQVPSRVGLELAKLDPGESSTALTQGNDLVFLMLCHRRQEAAKPPTDAEVQQQVLNQRLNQLADNYLAQLKADAIFRRP